MFAGVAGGFQDAVHITAILGESVVFNCQVEFPADHPVPYVLQWEKKVGDTVGHPTHTHTSLSLSWHCARASGGATPSFHPSHDSRTAAVLHQPDVDLQTEFTCYFKS